MNRITSDNTFEMDMRQLALNQVYIGKDGWAWYRNAPEEELSVCDLIRTAAETLDVDLPMLSDAGLSGLLMDWLQYGAGEPEGILAILCRALCAMAEVRARLAAYEDTGLEPEEIKEYKASYIEIITRTYGPFHQKIGQWLQAEKDGRLVVLPPNDPLTLEELREMDGEPVWVVELNGCPPRWGLVYWCRKNKRDIVYVTTNNGASICAETFMAAGGGIYRRKPEEGTA